MDEYAPLWCKSNFSFLEGASHADSLVGWDEICERNGGLVALWHDLLADELPPPPSLVGQLRAAFGDRLHALLPRHRRADDVPREARLRERAAAAELPLVAATEVL